MVSTYSYFHTMYGENYPSFNGANNAIPISARTVVNFSSVLISDVETDCKIKNLYENPNSQLIIDEKIGHLQC